MHLTGLFKSTDSFKNETPLLCVVAMFSFFVCWWSKNRRINVTIVSKMEVVDY